jgi:hypothetical protein
VRDRGPGFRGGATVVFADRQATNNAPAYGRYLPEYTKEGDLILPKNWRSWIYVGSPLSHPVAHCGGTVGVGRGSMRGIP